MDYQTMTRDQQNQILRQNGYRWVKIDQDWLDANDDFDTEPGWYLYATGGREVTIYRAFAEIERGADVVAEEIRVAAENERREAQKRRDLNTWKKYLADKIMDGGERPNGEHSPDGERLLDTQNIYGGGDWFIIETDRIWYVRNNGMDGDNWSNNNVRTGGAGGIGMYIPFDELIANELRTLDSGELPYNMPWAAYWN